MSPIVLTTPRLQPGILLCDGVIAMKLVAAAGVGLTSK
jgi:hypothetical protein